MQTIQGKIAERMTKLEAEREKNDAARMASINWVIDGLLKWTRSIGIADKQVKFPNAKTIKGTLNGNDLKTYRLDVQITVDQSTVELQTNCALYWNGAKGEWVWKERVSCGDDCYDIEETNKVSLLMPRSDQEIRNAKQLEDFLVSAFAKKELEAH